MPTTVVVSRVVSLSSRENGMDIYLAQRSINTYLIKYNNSNIYRAFTLCQPLFQVLLTIYQLLLTLVLYWLIVSMNCLWCSGWLSDHI